MFPLCIRESWIKALVPNKSKSAITSSKECTVPLAVIWPGCPAKPLAFGTEPVVNIFPYTIKAGLIKLSNKLQEEGKCSPILTDPEKVVNVSAPTRNSFLHPHVAEANINLNWSVPVIIFSPELSFIRICWFVDCPGNTTKSKSSGVPLIANNSLPLL